MACKLFNDQLEAYALGLLDEKEHAKVHAHVQTCPECQRELARHRQAASLIEKAFDQHPPAYLRAKVLANLKDVKTKKSSWIFWAAPGLAGLAALVLFIKTGPDQALKSQVAGNAPAETAAPAAPTAIPVESASTAADETREKSKTEPEKKTLPSRRRRQALSPQAKPAGSFAQGGTETRPAPRGMSVAAPKPAAQAGRASAKKSAEAVPGAVAAPASEPETAARFEEQPSSPAMGGAALGYRAASKSMQAAPLRASHADDAEKDAAYSKSAAPILAEPAHVQKPIMVQVNLVEMQGPLDRARVIHTLSALEQRLADKMNQAVGPGRTVQIKLSLDPQGRVTQIEFLGKAFDSESLNQDVRNEIQALKFNAPARPAPATVIFQIETK